MTTESRISFLEGALTQVSERLRDHTERFTAISQDIQSLRMELNAHVESLRAEIATNRTETNARSDSMLAEMNANVQSLRAENATTRRESRWIGGIIISGIVVVVITSLATRVF